MKEEKSNPWYEKAKKLEIQLENEKTNTTKLLMKIQRLIVNKLQEIVDEIDELYEEIWKEEVKGK